MNKSGAQAVHPGYGFLSENFAFCRALSERNVAFIGPNVESMRQLGDKIESKRIAIKHGVSTVPGHDGVVPDVSSALKIGSVSC